MNPYDIEYKTLIRALLLLALAFLSMIVIFPIAFIIQIIRHLWLLRLRPLLTKFIYGLALAFDYLFAYLIFGVYHHTVSALVFKKQIGWAINFIDWLFQDDTHCMTAFNDEFKTLN